MVYTYSFIAAYVGLKLQNLDTRTASVWSMKDLVRLVIRLLPCMPLFIVSELKWQGYPFAIKLIFKYLLPPFLGNLYLFGYSDHILDNYFPKSKSN